MFCGKCGNQMKEGDQFCGKLVYVIFTIVDNSQERSDNPLIDEKFVYL